ncbi:MAG TPA: cobalt-precorrin 5A hydrolase [Syntrophomonadaceae bacterium]|nr:cobalt-precorrin 5A hydrolase [Syntrophomonadaceae bacterium]
MIRTLNMNTDRRHDNRLAILSLTEEGSRLGQRLSRRIEDAQLYIPSRLQANIEENDQVHYFQHWEEAFGQAFDRHSRLVCIMAAGIVVRSLAARMVSKFVDPAVVVMDEKGRHAISLLSGHMGGANQLAREVAAILGGDAVITTATDVQGQPAVDLMAQDMEAGLEPLKNLKGMNRLLAEKEMVYLYSPWPLIAPLRKGFTWQEWPSQPEIGSDEKYLHIDHPAGRFLEPAVVVTYHTGRLAESPRVIQIRPRNLSVGIGCRRGVAWADMEAAFAEVLGRFHIDPAGVRSLATIDMKAREPALERLAEQLEVPILAFTREEIQSLDGSYPSSAWVQENIGVGGVCEPAARLATSQGITLVPKQKSRAVTISVAMEKSWWWDWDPVNGST